MIQILTYLDSLHACLHPKLIHQFLCLNNTVAAAHLSWHCLQYMWRRSKKYYYNVNTISLFHTKRSGRKMMCFTWSKESAQEGLIREAPDFPFPPAPPFYSLLGSVQRLCDIKGHTTQCWKCHTHHTSLHSHHRWKDYWHYKALCCALGMFSAFWLQYVCVNFFFFFYWFGQVFILSLDKLLSCM